VKGPFTATIAFAWPFKIAAEPHEFETVPTQER